MWLTNIQLQFDEDDENSNVAMATAVDQACSQGNGNQVAGQENKKMPPSFNI